MKKVMEEEIKEQAEMLRKVVMMTDKICLGVEMFSSTFWEKLWQCSILQNDLKRSISQVGLK